MLKPGDTIEYLADVSSPPNQKGVRGQTKIIDREIPLWTARFLLHGGLIRPFDPASPLQLEEEETEKSPDESAEVLGPGALRPGAPGPGAPGPVTETKTKAKKERSTSNNGQGKTINERNQTGDHGPKKPNPKRKARNSRH